MRVLLLALLLLLVPAVAGAGTFHSTIDRVSAVYQVCWWMGGAYAPSTADWLPLAPGAGVRDNGDDVPASNDWAKFQYSTIGRSLRLVRIHSRLLSESNKPGVGESYSMRLKKWTGDAPTQADLIATSYDVTIDENSDRTVITTPVGVDVPDDVQWIGLRYSAVVGTPSHAYVWFCADFEDR